MSKLENKNKFLKQGYFVVRNLLSKEEISEFSKEIDRLYDLEYEKNIKVRMGIHPYEKFWGIINNKKLIDSLSEIFDKKFNFLYQAGILQTIEGKEYLHHRDNPCRKFELALIGRIILIIKLLGWVFIYRITKRQSFILI